MKKVEETARQVHNRMLQIMLNIWPEVRVMARTEGEVATVEEFTEAFQALLLADKIIKPPSVDGE